MTDDLGLFGGADTDHRTERMRRAPRRPAPKRKRTGRRVGIWVGTLVVVALIAGGVWYGLTQVMGFGSYDDYAGPGESDVVVEVKEGETTSEIATRLAERDVVASATAFIEASESEPDIRGVQPGYYVMKTKMSGKAAVAKILDPESRVGNLQITAGSQLDDLTKPGGGKVSGIISKLSDASCAELNGESTCVSPKDLRAAMVSADLAALGIPEWAVPVVEDVEPKRRLEGLVMPGVYEVRPGSTADELWQQLITSSSARLQAAGMPAISEDSGFTPYQVLIMASLIEREGIVQDFAKVSRVTYNRLAESMELRYDSTINYMLDRPAIRTSDADRGRPGPYNTYLNTGLPPTPISSPSPEAIEAAAKPADGPWLYFVRCYKDGRSCFAKTHAKHQQNVQEAQARGAY